MTGLIQPLLAASDDGTGKLIGFVILAIFWGIGALASAMKKANQSAKTRVPPPLPTEPPTPLPPQRPQGMEWARMKIPNRIVSRPTAVAAKPPAPPAQRKVKRSKSAQQAAKRAAPPSQPTFTAGIPSASRIGAAAIGVADRPADAAAPSVGLRDLSASMTAQAMRKQFVIAELLQPPLALREQNH